jgi:hypothetical protein
MRRIMLLVTVALVMAAMVAFAAGPAFAVFNCNDTPQGEQCQGGSGFGTGGSGGHARLGESAESLPLLLTGGGGHGDSSNPASSGGSGRHCVLDTTTESEYDCVGSG